MAVLDWTKAFISRFSNFICNNQVRVAELSRWDNNVWCWNFPWSYSEDPLVEGAKVLNFILQEVALKASCDDFWIWILESSKTFTVRSCYNHLVKARLARSKDSDLKLALNGLWKLAIPSKVIIFG